MLEIGSFNGRIRFRCPVFTSNSYLCFFHGCRRVLGALVFFSFHIFLLLSPYLVVSPISFSRSVIPFLSNTRLHTWTGTFFYFLSFFHSLFLQFLWMIDPT